MIFAALAFAGMAALHGFRTVSQMNVPGNPGLPRYGMQDFRDGAYYPALSFLEGHNPYDAPQHKARYPVDLPFPLYSPMMFVLHLPFAFMTHAHAQDVDLVMNILLVPVLAFVSLCAAGWEATFVASLTLSACLLATRPGQMTIFLGQGAVYLTLATYVALHFARTRRWLAALGLAVTFAKPTFGVPLFFLLLCRGDWWTALVGASLAGLVSLVACAALVPMAGGLWPFVETLRATLSGWGQNEFTTIAESTHRVDAYLLAGRVFGRTLTTAEDLAITVAIFGLAAWALLRLARAGSESAQRLGAQIACATILTGAYHQTYDVLLLMWPALAVARADLAAPVRWAVLAAVVVPALNFFASSSAIDRLGLTGASWTVATTANSVAVLACFLLLVGIGMRSSRRSNGRMPASSERE